MVPSTTGELLSVFDATGDNAVDWQPSYSVAPTNRAPIVREWIHDETVTRDVDLASWVSIFEVVCTNVRTRLHSSEKAKAAVRLPSKQPKLSEAQEKQAPGRRVPGGEAHALPGQSSAPVTLPPVHCVQRSTKKPMFTLACTTPKHRVRCADDFGK